MVGAFGTACKTGLTAAAATLLLGACTTLSVDLPALTDAPTAQRNAGSIIWHDLLTEDIDASRAFYGGLFGWTFEELPLSLGIGRSSRYLLIRNQGRLIGGMLDISNLDSKVNGSQWITVMSVADIESAVVSVEQAGGTVETPPTDLNARGRIAVVRDNTGAVFAMLQTRDGDPLQQASRPGDFFWDEVWTSDIDKAATFYQALAPLQRAGRDTAAGRYHALVMQDQPRFGLLQDPVPGLDPTWAPYIKVADMTVLERVAGLGGTVALPAEPRALGGEVALILGPSGAGVVLQTWPEGE